ncbi:hypothetical protein PpBr36_07807 [Pyricularia pennisetigena]|uniref:hypothetical protein n=1 Tax=Pyricularia pennisetigena TaxID=1578925 RepID=UPI00115190DC|nr:hypothetical protein PpBr36_07807 [Pyricularia pennisetigena]TLS25636.1 hypothetical protein PpBr36_07807 [Pyricularia pennisetigena]
MQQRKDGQADAGGDEGVAGHGPGEAGGLDPRHDEEGVHKGRHVEHDGVEGHDGHALQRADGGEYHGWVDEPEAHLGRLDGAALGEVDYESIAEPAGEEHLRHECPDDEANKQDVTTDKTHQYQAKQYVTMAIGTTVYLNVLTNRTMVSSGLGWWMPGTGATLTKGSSLVRRTSGGGDAGAAAAFFSRPGPEEPFSVDDDAAIKSRGYSVSGKKASSATRMVAKRMAHDHCVQAWPARPPGVDGEHPQADLGPALVLVEEVADDGQADVSGGADAEALEEAGGHVGGQGRGEGGADGRCQGHDGAEEDDGPAADGVGWRGEDERAEGQAQGRDGDGPVDLLQRGRVLVLQRREGGHRHGRDSHDDGENRVLLRAGPVQGIQRIIGHRLREQLEAILCHLHELR